MSQKNAYLIHTRAEAINHTQCAAHIEHVAGWAPQLIWTLKEENNLFTRGGIRRPARLARSPVSLETQLYRVGCMYICMCMYEVCMYVCMYFFYSFITQHVPLH
jgi:hypothetical protein